MDVARDKDLYKEPQSDPVEDVDPTELTGKFIAGKTETCKLWKSWLAKKKTAMPAAKVEKTQSFRPQDSLKYNTFYLRCNFGRTKHAI